MIDKFKFKNCVQDTVEQYVWSVNAADASSRKFNDGRMKMPEDVEAFAVSHFGKRHVDMLKRKSVYTQKLETGWLYTIWRTYDAYGRAFYDICVEESRPLRKKNKNGIHPGINVFYVEKLKMPLAMILTEKIIDIDDPVQYKELLSEYDVSSKYFEDECYAACLR